MPNPTRIRAELEERKYQEAKAETLHLIELLSVAVRKTQNYAVRTNRVTCAGTLARMVGQVDTMKLSVELVDQS